MRTALSALALLLLAGCAHDFGVERRETPLHLWLTVPDAAARGGRVHAEVRVGPYEVVAGPVEFPPGVTTVRLPTQYLAARTYPLVASFGGGRVRTSASVPLGGETWAHIVLRGAAASVSVSGEEPPVPTR
jgi:hypothetical protein